ncbi:MAG: phosphatidylglycerol lysyltransferase domain-containing protein, partial [Pseudoflavonifractor sp.]
VMEVFQNYEAYGLLGGMLMADNRVAALAAGEIVGDTLFVHIEKADLSFPGAYQTIVREFAGYYGGNTAYINREEDVGDAGLRTSKLSYHPLKLLEKYTVEVAL